MQFLPKLKKIKIHTWPFIPRVKPKGSIIHSSLWNEAWKSSPLEFLPTQISGASVRGSEENLACSVRGLISSSSEKNSQSQVQASVL